MHTRTASHIVFALALVSLALPAWGQEEKDSPGPDRRRFRALGARMDFGPLEDGKAQAHENLAKQGWIYLFDSRAAADGKRAGDPLGLWRIRNPEEPKRNLWSVMEEGGERILRNTVGQGQHGSDLISQQSFWDCDVHAEIRVPPGSNSGLYLRGRYEIQILDTPADKKDLQKSDLGGVYNVAAPSKNASKGAGAWQTLEVSIRGFRVAVVRLNGEVIHEGVEIPEDRRGGTGSELGKGDGVNPSPDAPGPIFLQGDHGSVDFRNIRVRPMPGFQDMEPLRGPGRPGGRKAAGEDRKEKD